MPTVSRDFIMSGQSAAGGWSKPQLALIGVPWPPQPGWIDCVIGAEISADDAARFRNSRQVETVARAIYMTHRPSPEWEAGGHPPAPVWEQASEAVKEWTRRQAANAIAAAEAA